MIRRGVYTCDSTESHVISLDIDTTSLYAGQTRLDKIVPAQTPQAWAAVEVEVVVG